MEVHHHHATHADRRQQVGDDLGRDRHARRARASVLPRVPEIRDHRRNPAGRRALQRVGHDQDFHQVVVGRNTRRLQDEDVATAHVLEELDHHFAVRKPADDAASEADVEVVADGFGKLRIRVAGEHAHPFESHLPDPRRSAPARRVAAIAVLRQMAGEEGFEPSDAGIKIRCLNQLGDSPAEKP